MTVGGGRGGGGGGFLRGAGTRGDGSWSSWEEEEKRRSPPSAAPFQPGRELLTICGGEGPVVLNRGGVGRLTQCRDRPHWSCAQAHTAHTPHCVNGSCDRDNDRCFGGCSPPGFESCLPVISRLCDLVERVGAGKRGKKIRRHLNLLSVRGSSGVARWGQRERAGTQTEICFALLPFSKN